MPLGVLIAALVVAFAAAGCAPEPPSERNMPAPSSAPRNLPGGNSGNPGDLDRINDQIWSQLRGNYSGVLNKQDFESGSAVSQGFQAEVFAREIEDLDGTYASIDFQSSGDIGPVNFTSVLAIPVNGQFSHTGYDDQGNPVAYYEYQFISEVLDQPLLSPSRLAVELDLFVRYTQQGDISFDPAQSRIHLRTCVLTDGGNPDEGGSYDCSSRTDSLYGDAYFGTDLRKQ